MRMAQAKSKVKAAWLDLGKPRNASRQHTNFVDWPWRVFRLNQVALPQVQHATARLQMIPRYTTHSWPSLSAEELKRPSKRFSLEENFPPQRISELPATEVQHGV